MILIKILQFILAFSLLVFVHELGHFLAAKMFRVRVDRFMLFFGRPIVKFKIGETTYGIGWLPFGGYCKLAGMVDESMDTEQLKGEPQKWEFRYQRAWKRLIMMLGGIIMNVLLAAAIYIGLIATWGDTYLSTRDMKWGYTYNSLIHSEFGLQNGDKIISINGHEVEDFADLAIALLVEQGNRMEVERDLYIDSAPECGNDERVARFSIVIPTVSVDKLAQADDLIVPRYPFVADSVLAGYGAAAAGVRRGDSLVSVNGEQLLFYDQYAELLPEFADSVVQLGLVREGEYLTLPVAVSSGGLLGIAPDRARYFHVYRRNYTLLEAVPAGISRVSREVVSYWKQLKMMFRPKTEAYKSMSGPLGIGNIFPKEWDWYVFWRITALLSIALAIMNLLPIPALDGGHIFLILIEMITGRRASEQTLIRLQAVGMFILIGLMVLVTWNDIQRLFF